MKAIVVLFITGAVLGTLGDWTHVISNVVGYPNSFMLIPVTQQAFWVPLLFGSAGVAIALSHAKVDQWLKVQRPKKTWLEIALGIIALLLLYGISGFLNFEQAQLRNLLLMTAAVSIWFAFDRSKSGLLFALLTAAVGVTVEATLVHLGAFYYGSHVIDFLGFPFWIVWLYVAASVAVGNLGRKLLSENAG